MAINARVFVLFLYPLVWSLLGTSIVSNGELCGEPLKACNQHKMKFDYSFKSGFIIGYVASIVSVITIFMSYCVPWMDVKESIKLLMARYNKRKETDQMTKFPTIELLLEENEEISVLEELVARISLTDISRATDNFSENNVIGLGKMGTVYKATFHFGLYLTIMRYNDSQHFDEHFLSEIKILGRLEHVNLVPLLGFCRESKERLLIYKCMPNGNLYNWLHTTEGRAKFTDWSLRVKVAIGLARGLAWLHHSCNFRVAHLNISSKNILLDDNFEPKLLNFGRAMALSRSFTINHEFWEIDFVKKDVYNFGVVLLELITGKEPNKMKNSSISYDENLDYWIARLSMSTYGVYDAIDRSLIGRGFDGEIFELLKVACDCFQPSPQRRPTMLEVYKTISAVGERYGLTADSEKSMVTEISTPSFREYVEVESCGLTDDSKKSMGNEISTPSFTEYIEVEMM